MSPQPLLGCPGRLLRFPHPLVVVVFLVVPRHSIFEHFQIDVPVPQQDVPDSSAVFVLGLGDHHHILAKDFFAQGFLGSLPKRLLDLRGINGVEPDLELSL